MISKASIDDIRNRIDIVDVVGDFVSLKRSGQNFKALSPFTNEKTASFYVVPAKGIFKDFSSGKGGDAITFVMEHEGMSYVEALRYLAKKYGVEIVEDVNRGGEVLQSDRDSLYILMNFAKDYYHDLLVHNEEGRSIGLSYFHERSFNDRTIQKFELGFSLREWDHFCTTAISKGYSKEMLEKAGLMIQKEGGKFYDRFRGRVIFPVHNLAGKVIAFGGRILTKEKDQPKYINSPETDIYHKSQVLYGMFQAKNAIRRDNFCYLVEGYTDVISMHQADVDNVVASSGTALTEEQIKLIRRFTDNITILFDGDSAGIKAALRGIDMILKGGLNVRIVLLPDGEDPDSYSKRLGSTAFKKYLADHVEDFISFKINLFAVDAAKDPIKKAELIREIVTSIAAIPDSLKRTIYIQECHSKLQVPISILTVEVNKLIITERKEQADKRKEPVVQQNISLSEVHSIARAVLISPGEMLERLEREFLKVLILLGDKKNLNEEYNFDVLFNETEDVEFINPVNQEIIDLYKVEIAKGNIHNADEFIQLLSSEQKAYVADFLVQKYQVSEKWKDYNIFITDEYNENSVDRVIQRLKLAVILNMRSEYQQKLAATKEAEEQNGLIEILTKVDEFKNALSNLLGRVVIAPPKLLEL
ncbi:MAG TPA: DNA primase [Cyclobacteriaceae bacterium]|nr:DNA primase [Cyclobacteriaceae bacterium]